MQQQPLTERVAAVSALDEPIRRALFEHVSRSDSSVSRDEAAEALGLARSTAAFHLDRLAEEGLLAGVQAAHRADRPGSGRPAKLYRRAAEEIAVSVPERHYDPLVRCCSPRSRSPPEPVSRRARRCCGSLARPGDTGSGTGSLQQVLEDHGYEPRPDGEGGLVLRNCPFHRLAQHTQVVCHVNLELLRGAAEGTNDPTYTMVLDPGIGRCCVRAVPQHMSAESTPARQT